MSASFDANREREFLNGLVQDYTDSSPYSEIKKEIIVQLMLTRITLSGARGLQFGCANGYETGRLAGHLGVLDVVDGSSIFIDRLRKENHASNIAFHLSLFEDYDHHRTGKLYDYVSCNYILEHVFDTALILRNIHGMLAKHGFVFITVPNALALSRRLAKEMGLVASLYDLTENDHKHGHRRTYTLESLRSEVYAAGFDIIETSGIVLKILADFQLNKLLKDGFLTREHVFGLQKLATQEDNIAFSDSIFMVLQKQR
jgi:2-polyprenyl-3-methyl-5-hydroxy-6-metoxy-1,4-benzoquinol methylase